MSDDATGSRDATVREGYTRDVDIVRNNHVETVYKVALVVVLLVVLFNLGQALFFMMTDKDGSKRTVWALTRRIGLSIVLILMVVFGIWMGWLHPHDVGQ
jgi:cytochrome bd-type quinol oxidase subunit 2